MHTLLEAGLVARLDLRLEVLDDGDDGDDLHTTPKPNQAHGFGRRQLC